MVLTNIKLVGIKQITQKTLLPFYKLLSRNPFNLSTPISRRHRGQSPTAPPGRRGPALRAARPRSPSHPNHDSGQSTIPNTNRREHAGRFGNPDYQPARAGRWTAGPNIRGIFPNDTPTSRVRQHQPSCHMHNRSAERNRRAGTNRPSTWLGRQTSDNEGSDTDVDETFYHRYRTTHQQSSTTTDELIRRSGRILPRSSYATDGANSTIPHAAREVASTRGHQQSHSPPGPLRVNIGNSDNIANGQTMQASTARPDTTVPRERPPTPYRPVRLSPSDGWRRLVNHGNLLGGIPLNTEPTPRAATLRVSPYFSTPPNGRQP